MFDTALTIAQAIQIAVAPVFLLTGIAAMLAVFTNRLNGVLERARELREVPLHGTKEISGVERRLRALRRRAHLLHGATAFATGSALGISMVIAVIFIGFIGEVRTATLVAYLFVAATVAFVVALLLFLAEVNLATQCVRFVPRVRRAPPAATVTDTTEAVGPGTPSVSLP